VNSTGCRKERLNPLLLVRPQVRAGGGRGCDDHHRIRPAEFVFILKKLIVKIQTKWRWNTISQEGGRLHHFVFYCIFIDKPGGTYVISHYPSHPPKHFWNNDFGNASLKNSITRSKLKINRKSTELGLLSYSALKFILTGVLKKCFVFTTEYFIFYIKYVYSCKSIQCIRINKYYMKIINN
jgi:hypothetical protein